VAGAMSDAQVTIRGTSEGLIIEFGTGDLQSVLRELNLKLGQSASFFRGGRVAVRVGSRILNRDEIESLGHTLYRWGVTLWAVESDAVETRAAAQSLSLETDLTARRPIGSSTPDGQMEEEERRTPSASSALLVKRTLRSGASIVHEGHVVVIGDVNAGAEIIAGGDIVVWGKLRGLAHAGAGGDESAVVCALRMLPSQLRIGSKVAIKPRDAGSGREEPQTASISGDDIILQAWTESLASQSERSRSLFGNLWRRIGRAFGK
jgi:septum site-determining protein MinC